MLVSAILAWSLVAARGWASRGPERDVRERLPVATRPVSYDLRFDLTRAGRSSAFGGVATIVVSVVSVTDTVVLNVKDLAVTGVTVADADQPAPGGHRRSTYRVRDERERLEIRVAAGELTPGREYVVTVVYEGLVRTDSTGLYARSYDAGNATNWLIVTHLQPVYARRAFPCYDEPSYKAVFNISVTKQKNYIALSNMPVKSISDVSNDMEMVSFESTPSMSSYLVAIFVGEFVSNKNNSFITVYSHKNNINRTEYVRIEALKHLQALEEYTGIKYMLPKLDMLAIPNDFFVGMENWGITIYEEQYLLMNEKSKNIVVSTRLVQHELTHQWIGNLVTCSWWDFTWLNEGIAKYFEYFVTGMVKTSWPMEELFVVEVHLDSLTFDQSTRLPITRSVYTQQEIEHVFDTITYCKAASVLRMLRYMVTENLFQLSIRQYLNKHQGKVVDPNMLYESFDNVLMDNDYVFGNGLTVNQFMMNWTLQSGYPVISVTKNETSNTFSITQRRFFIDAIYAKASDDLSAWHIGLTYTTETSKNFSCTLPTVWTNQTSALTVTSAPKTSGWYIFNVQATGFYRVNYDAVNWMALIEQLTNSANAIHVLNRAQLVDDSFNLAKAGQLSFLVPLRLTEYLVHERSVTPWRPAMKELIHLFRLMPRQEKGYTTLKAHISKLAGVIYCKILDDLALNGDVNVETFRDEFKWTYTLDNEYCATEALKRFERWRAGEKIPEIFMEAALCMGVKTSTGSETFNQVFNLYTSTPIIEKNPARLALCCSGNRTQLIEYINHILNGPRGPIMMYEFRTVVSTLSTMPLGFEVLCEFLSNNWNRILNEISFGKAIISYIYSVLVNLPTNDSELQKIKDLKHNSSLPKSMRSSFEEFFLEINRKQQQWTDMHTQGIGQWALEYKIYEEDAVEDLQNTTTEAINDLNNYQLRLYDIYPEKISKWALEHNEIDEERVEKIELNSTNTVAKASKQINDALIVLLFVIFLILLCIMFYLLK